jgi:hypothetical protein
MTTREDSRRDFISRGTVEDANSGSLQRIADACERMATNWTAVATERDKFRKLWLDERESHQRSNAWRDERIAKLEHRITSLKGVITKMRRTKGGAA